MELAVFFTVIYAATVVLGIPLSRLRVPWMFASLLLGIVLAAWNPWSRASASTELAFMGEVGMYLYLFVVGFEMEIDKIFREGKFIVIMAMVLFATELAASSIFIHFAFSISWITALVVGFTFATVGEALLIPIFREFGLLQSSFGQRVLGIAFVDNLFEVLAVILVAVFLLAGHGGDIDTAIGSDGGEQTAAMSYKNSSSPGSAIGSGNDSSRRKDSLRQNTESPSASAKPETAQKNRIFGRPPGRLSLWGAGLSVAALFTLTWLLRKISRRRVKSLLESARVTHVIEMMFAAVLVVFFGFIAIGTYAEAAALGALLAGIAVKPILPEKEDVRVQVTADVRTVAYGVFGVPFFVSVGMHIDLQYLLDHFLLVLILIAIVKVAKILPSLALGYRRFGFKESLATGVSLAMKFSTSIVLIKLLYDTGQIERNLYSVLIAAKILFKFIVPFLLSIMLSSWNIGDKRDKATEHE